MISDTPTVVTTRSASPTPGLREEAAAAPSAAPMTAEEVAALARRIRVEAKLKGITVVGTVLGIVCGGATIWPFLDSRGYIAESLVGGEFGGLGFLPGWLLAGLLPLLAFYAGRLQFQTGRSSTDEIETSLRKIRRVILGSMFASAAAFVLVLAERQSERIDGASWMAFTYAACFTACGIMVGDVRRGLGDFDSEHQRRRRKLARGFAVELRPVETPAYEANIPWAARAGPGNAPVTTAGQRSASTPGPALPIGHAIPLPTTVPQPTPALPALPAMLSDVGEDEHFKDLRLLMTLAIAVAIGIYAVRLGDDLTVALRQADSLELAFERALWPGNPSAGANMLSTALALAAASAAVLLTLCAVLWLVWGILSLNYGPTFRRSVGWLTVVTLALGVLCVLPSWVYGLRDIGYRRERFEPGMLSRAPEIVHALFLGLLLTRPGVKRLFARSSRTDDPD